jgi:transcriptional regulator with XRE-family HTH domain
MSKRKPMGKEQARERRNALLAAAAAADLSLTEGVREMRAIAGMTQEEFARHREVSARVIKAIELGLGNPTVATLNRIGNFFGLEVGFVPVKRNALVGAQLQHADQSAQSSLNDSSPRGLDMLRKGDYRELAHMIAIELMQMPADAFPISNRLPESLAKLDEQLASGTPSPAVSAMNTVPASKKRKSRST